MIEPYIVKTELGEIVVDIDTLKSIITDSIKAFEKHIRLADDKADIKMSDGRISFKVNIHTAFGESIKALTSDLAERIRVRVKSITGKNPAKITLVVTGMTLKNKIVPRNIEVTKTYED